MSAIRVGVGEATVEMEPRYDTRSADGSVHVSWPCDELIDATVRALRAANDSRAVVISDALHTRMTDS